MENAWMNEATSVGEDDIDPMILPPPMAPTVVAITRNDRSHDTTPMATAEVIEEMPEAHDEEPAAIPAIASSWTAPGSASSRVESDNGAGIRRSSSAPQQRTNSERQFQTLSNVTARGSNNTPRGKTTVMEKLFGDSKPGGRRVPRHGFDSNSATSSVLPRTLLPWSVFLNGTTGVWVATVNTNQKALETNNATEASKGLKAFTAPTERQAEALAMAWAPPRMLPFRENPNCFICEARFAVFKRACHCRNCGVCICSNCTVTWPSKMILSTYNTKKEAMVKACKACEWLSSSFRLALLSGQYDQAVALHATGNVNLVTPFANVKGELLYPMHCAVLGGNLKLLKWLVDEHCCPTQLKRILGKSRDSEMFTSILTSRGRSLLGIAMEKNSIDIVRYLVVDKNIQLSNEKDVTMAMAINTLDKVLRLLPGDESDIGGAPESIVYAVTSTSPLASVNSGASHWSSPESPRSERSIYIENSMSDFDDHVGTNPVDVSDSDSVVDACIICFMNSIDCVATPCGHQFCCRECSSHISRCPVCSVNCTFIRVFKP